MNRWTGILKVPVCSNSAATCRVAASLCISPTYTLLVPTINAIFFNGDRVEGTGNLVIERLSDLQNIAEILCSKFGASINAWVIESSKFNGPFAVYKEFIQSLNQRGEPQSYRPNGFPASTSVVTLLSNFLVEGEAGYKKVERAKNNSQKEHQISAELATSYTPQTIILGFSKGGVVLNQLVTELSFSGTKATVDPLKPSTFSQIAENQIIPVSRESFFDSITEIHYLDVGLNCPGAYITDDEVIQKIADQLNEKDKSLHFVLHGTPRQWSDTNRPWIREEKDKFRQLLDSGKQKSKGKLEVSEKTYFADLLPNLQMHFEIIEKLVVK
ncbi:UPF0565 protein C2orf69-like protein [Bienertia sinuspersici]